MLLPWPCTRHKSCQLLFEQLTSSCYFIWSMSPRGVICFCFHAWWPIKVTRGNRPHHTALFLRLGVPSTIRHENGAFRKKMASQWINVISVTEFIIQTYPKGPAIITFLNSPGVAWSGGKRLIHFHSETSIFKLSGVMWFLCLLFFSTLNNHSPLWAMMNRLRAWNFRKFISVFLQKYFTV